MKTRTISEWVKEVHQTAIEKGWFEEERQRLELHMLMLTEISEATEEIRNHKPSFYIENGKPEGEAIELVDGLLRIFDYAGYKNIDLIHYLKSEGDNYRNNYLNLYPIPLASSWPIHQENIENVKGCSEKVKKEMDKESHGHIGYPVFTSVSGLSTLDVLNRIIGFEKSIAEKENIDFEILSELTEFFSVVSKNENWFKNYESFVSPLEKHMLFSMTIAEASQAVLKKDFEEEARLMARTLIQILVYFVQNNWDVNEILDEKHSFNMARAYKHGGKKC